MYKKILVALDFHSDNDQIVTKACKLVEEDSAELFLLHVNEPLAVAYSIDGMSFGEQVVALESSIREESVAKMVQVGLNLEVPESRQLICDGKPSAEIHRMVEENDIDLIVMGTHGQSGLQLLLGSTANSVLHGVSCDVLAVRIKEA